MDERARLLNVKELLTLYDLARAKVEKDVSVGDIVACFGNDDTLIGIGTVKHVGHVRLSPHHEDGEFGEVFVLPFSKTRINKRKDLTGVVASSEGSKSRFQLVGMSKITSTSFRAHTYELHLLQYSTYLRKKCAHLCEKSSHRCAFLFRRVHVVGVHVGVHVE